MPFLPTGNYSRSGMVPILADRIMKINNFELALLAEHHQSASTEMGLFGNFESKNYAGQVVPMAMTARRYAYVGSPLCLNLWSCNVNEGGFWEPYVDITKNIRPNDCKSDEIIVKTYEENEHIRQPLLDTGYFEDTGKKIKNGFVSLEIWRLTEKFVAVFEAAHQVLESA